MAMSQTPSIRMEQGLATRGYGQKGLQVAITTYDGHRSVNSSLLKLSPHMTPLL